MPERASGVVYRRGGLVESSHRVHVAVVDWRGRLLGRAGDARRVTFLRSAAKPFQAFPLVEDGVVEALGLSPEELALACGSHGADARHVEGALRILARAGAAEEALECGPHAPLDEANAAALVRAGREPRRVHNNCSGKHAAMIALAHFHGWPVRGYARADHPVQRRMLAEISRWSEVPETGIRTATDGCGVVCFALPLDRAALAFAGFARAARDGGPASEVVGAMTAHPFYVAGEGRLCTELMMRAGDRLFVKVGAEGVYGAGLLDGAVGVALKVEDGDRRSAEVALLRVLEELGILSAAELEGMRDFARPTLRNTVEERVGEVVPEFELEALVEPAARPTGS